MRNEEDRIRYIIQAGFAGMEGSLLLSVQRRDELLSRCSEEFLNGCLRFESMLSAAQEKAMEEAAGARRVLKVCKGGIFGALWELGEAEDSGMDVWLPEILLRQETIEICEYFDISPYRLLSGGCVLIAADRPEDLIEGLKQRRMVSAVIGRLRAGRDRVIHNGDGIRYLEPVRQDEYDRITAQGAGNRKE